jgi:predicted dehydrogenase/nucleoside-diphosphate-sugar epimerase
MSPAFRRVALVGAGVIARTHAEVLKSLPGQSLVAVVDPDLGAARRLAGEGVPVFAMVEEMLAAGVAGRAHVLVPPPLHAAVARPLLDAGIAVLLEKPLAATAAECEALLEAAAAGAAVLGVNQNFVHHPAFARLRRLVETHALGRPRFVDCTYSMPLRQLQAQQFGHWMFAAPGNILLEQAVHPLSQILALAGPVAGLRTLADPTIELAPGVPFCPAVTITLQGARLPATLRFAVGQSFPVWQVSVVCDDGVITADIQAGRVLCQTRGRWLEAADTLFAGLRAGGAIAGESLTNFAAYGRAMLGLGPRSDPFFQSMRASIAAFHEAVDEGRAPALDGRFGTDLVRLCETIRDQAFPAPPPAAPPPATPPPATAASVAAAPAAAADIAILGGTGFIGRHLVRLCLEDGLRVAVLARSIRNLPAIFADPRVTLHRGSVTDADAVGRAIAGAPVVINLAHGGGGGSWAQVQAAMVGSAEIVARACLAQGVRRLVHVGSIAGLYLGPQPHPITGATPPDPQAARRADYARAKAECDRMLLDLHTAERLPVVILRPGIVVGAGSAPFHSGVGLFNNEQHCIGWNDGRNALPFVLAADVAAALLAAARAPGIDGRCYNLVGDVRPDARTYIAELARALDRPLRYHPQSVDWLWLEDLGKWTVKRIAGRRVPVPSRRDFLSRGMRAAFDCSDAKRDLGWQPVAEPVAFFAQAIGVHAA